MTLTRADREKLANAVYGGRDTARLSGGLTAYLRPDSGTARIVDARGDSLGIVDVTTGQSVADVARLTTGTDDDARQVDDGTRVPSGDDIDGALDRMAAALGGSW